MPEQIDVTTPVGAVPGTPSFRVSMLIMNYDTGTMLVDVVGIPDGRHLSFQYDNMQPTMQALNVANLSVKSLQRRILEKLVADGKLPGVITGVP
jgi:hypothetical protein